jgi:DNA polymerase III subunit epsilon
VHDSWVAIDFETASTRGTPCAVGLVEVEAGRLGACHGWLICPPVFEFWPFNVALHGITPEMCADAPSWPESLHQVLAIADGRVLVAHNAAFDLGVLRDACGHCDLEWPTIDYFCTLVISRRAWPELASHSLPFVAEHLGFKLANRHDPRGDATMCARIGQAALQECGSATLGDLARHFSLMAGRIEAGTWLGCHGLDHKPELPTEPSEHAHPGLAHPLFGKSVTFTGALAVPRRQAQQAVVDCGGTVTRGPTRETDLVVTGYQDLTVLAAGATRSAKLVKAEHLRAAGQPLDIISERDFVRLLTTAVDPSA